MNSLSTIQEAARQDQALPPNLSLNPDAPSAGARSNILTPPPSQRAG